MKVSDVSNCLPPCLIFQALPAMTRSPFQTATPFSVDVGQAVTHEAIAARAKELWDEQGRPQNCDNAIWLEAEAELLAMQQGRFRHPHRQLTSL
jgi:hypothetical protein